MAKKKLKYLLSLSATVLVLSIVSWYSYELGICTDKYKCYDFALSYSGPITVFTTITTILFSILLLFREDVIRSWLKLTLLIPLSLIWIFSTPTFCGSLICFDRNSVAWITSIVFAVISLIFVGIKSIRKKSQ